MKTFMGNAKSLGPASIINIDDLRKFGKRGLPRAVFDYLEEAPRAKSLFENNLRAFSAGYFQTEASWHMGTVDPRTQVLGQQLSLPAILVR
jgi:isopentenyl diphosphate isomerase/L-lactate dehydrogenase-like FMN-dependent dehydrogenase